MTYEVIGASAKDPNFQNRCRGAAIAMAADILNAVQDSGAIQDSKGGDLTTLASRNGGQFPYVSGMTIRAAVSTAGGYTDTANRQRATIYRKVGDQMHKSVVDLDFPIFPGDTIVIAERWL